MLEPAATVHCRKKDVSFVERASQGAKKQYKGISGRDITITVEGILADERCELSIFMLSRSADTSDP